MHKGYLIIYDRLSLFAKNPKTSNHRPKNMAKTVKPETQLLVPRAGNPRNLKPRSLIMLSLKKGIFRTVRPKTIQTTSSIPAITETVTETIISCSFFPSLIATHSKSLRSMIDVWLPLSN